MKYNPRCHDCLWRDFPRRSQMCPNPDFRESADTSLPCAHWEWRYQ